MTPSDAQPHADEVGAPNDGRGQAKPPQFVRHDPMWLNAGRHGRWCVCSCGWQSRNGTPALAQVEFGGHLLATSGVSVADLLGKGEP